MVGGRSAIRGHFMAEDDIDEVDDVDDGEGGEDGDAPKGKRRLLIVIVVVLLLLTGGLAAAYFTGLLDPLIHMITGQQSSEMDGELPPGSTVFYDMPDITVNLNTNARKPTFIKIKVALELENPQDTQRIEALMPRVRDNFVVYLRELRIDDLKGSAGMYRLREELLARVSNAVAPIKVKDVLFKEMLVQ